VLWGPSRRSPSAPTARSRHATEFRSLVIAYATARRSGSRSGRGQDDVERQPLGELVQRPRGIVLAIQRQPGTNTVAVADAVHALVDAAPAAAASVSSRP
jgi:hypothetical protein